MHQRTERLLCRLAFLILCALPTAVTMGILVAMGTPWYQQAQRAELEGILRQRFGVQFTIGNLRHPEPRVWQLEDVGLHDPETGEEAARVRTVYWAQEQDRIHLHFSQPEIQARKLGMLWKVFHDRVLCQPDLVPGSVVVKGKDLLLRGEGLGLTLTPVALWIDSGAEKGEANLQFSLAGENTQEVPATVRVTRSRLGAGPRTEWSLETGTSPLPCSILASYLPILRRLGSDALFTGVLRWELEREDYTVRMVHAKFDRVSLLEFSEPLDVYLSGLGTIELTSLTRHSGGPIVEAVGKLTVHQGRVDSLLLKRLAEQLGADVDRGLIESQSRIDCQLIALGFAIHGPEVRIHGLGYQHRGFENMPPGTIVVASNRCVLRADPQKLLATETLSQAVDVSGSLGASLGDGGRWGHRLLPQLRPTSQTQLPSPADDELPRPHGLKIRPGQRDSAERPDAVDRR